MRIRFTFTLAVSIVVPGTFSAPQMPAAKNISHVHIGHVMDGWKDTPEGKGLLPTAIAEAAIASQHAGFSAKKSGDLVWMKTHIRHVLHAVDPSMEAKGPGLGYGVIKAAMGAKKHINFSAGSPDASKNVKLHTPHVSTSLDNSVARAKEIVRICNQALGASSAAAAAPLVKKVNVLTGQLLQGADANGDGKITWKQNEGGLKEAEKHMGFMKKGEKLP